MPRASAFSSFDFALSSRILRYSSTAFVCFSRNSFISCISVIILSPRKFNFPASFLPMFLSQFRGAFSLVSENLKPPRLSERSAFDFLLFNLTSDSPLIRAFSLYISKNVLCDSVCSPLTYRCTRPSTSRRFLPNPRLSRPGKATCPSP